MSKHLRKKNPPEPPSEEDVETDKDDLLGATAPLPPAAATPLDASQRRQGEDSTAAGAKDGWWLMAEQIESLRAILLSLVTAVASSPAVSRQIANQLNAAERDPAQDSASTIAPATREETAIVGGAAAPEPLGAILCEPATTRSPDAILPATGGARETKSETPTAYACHRGHRLPQIKEFIAGGDWSAFTWRFESAFRSVHWTEVEALDALPTLLDDVSLGVFRSITASKKKKLRDAFAEMAEFYNPQMAATRKFMSRRRGPEESPLAYRGALVGLAMAAYPNATANHLDPLILSRMLELSQELNISLPVHRDGWRAAWTLSLTSSAGTRWRRGRGNPKSTGHHWGGLHDWSYITPTTPATTMCWLLLFCTGSRDGGRATCEGRVVRPPADDGHVFQVRPTRPFRPRLPLPTSAFTSSAEGASISPAGRGAATPTSESAQIGHPADEQVLRAGEAPAAPPSTGPGLDTTVNDQSSSLRLPPPVTPATRRP
ncbi:uncharacterized protein LOC144738063 [Lampetra planeri]